MRQVVYLGTQDILQLTVSSFGNICLPFGESVEVSEEFAAALVRSHPDSIYYSEMVAVSPPALFSEEERIGYLLQNDTYPANG